MKKFWEKFKVVFVEKVWPVLKALPTLLFKTRPGQWIISLIVTAILQQFFPEITFEVVSDFIKNIADFDFSSESVYGVLAVLQSILVIFYGKKHKQEAKNIVEAKRGKTTSDRIS